MVEYRYRYLPEGNAGDFPEIDAFLKERQVKAEVSEISDGRMYRVPVEDLSKMPSDETGPYFGTEESGWSFHADDWDHLRIEWGGSEWKELE
ncbi:hypothetical protein B1VFA_016 [Rhizobium phage B1VFA]|nr:hypothetical protein B1VFA_016 [Rhizobium phage B1VFA]